MPEAKVRTTPPQQTPVGFFGHSHVYKRPSFFRRAWNKIRSWFTGRKPQTGGPIGGHYHADWFQDWGDVEIQWQSQLRRDAVAEPIAIEIFKTRKDVFDFLISDFDFDFWLANNEVTSYLLEKRLARTVDGNTHLSDLGQDVLRIMTMRG